METPAQSSSSAAFPVRPDVARWLDGIGVIDAHAQLGEEHPYSLDSAALLRHMDAAGVATAIARPMGAELVAYNRAGNDRLLAAGPRVKAMISVNPWFGAPAADEMRRCRDRGAVGLFLHPSRQGFMPTESIAAPVIGLAAKWNWPITFHTGTYIQSDVLAVVEVARRFPGAPFVIGWAGFTDMWFELPGVMGETTNLYFDAGMIWASAVHDVANLHGAHRVLFGGGLPRNRYATVLAGMARWNFTHEQKRAILRDNAARLFGLGTQA